MVDLYEIEGENQVTFLRLRENGITLDGPHRLCLQNTAKVKNVLRNGKWKYVSDERESAISFILRLDIL